LFDVTKIAAKSLQCAQENEKEAKRFSQRAVAITIMCAMCICIFSAIFVAYVTLPEGDTVNINKNPVPLAAPSGSQMTDNPIICPICGNEIN